MLHVPPPRRHTRPSRSRGNLRPGADPEHHVLDHAGNNVYDRKLASVNNAQATALLLFWCILSAEQAEAATPVDREPSVHADAIQTLPPHLDYRLPPLPPQDTPKEPSAGTLSLAGYRPSISVGPSSGPR